MAIRQIQLYGTLPQVFAPRKESISSQVWLSDLTLKRGEHCLIEANSGVGKSSLCSYIYGNRVDYMGRIEFDGLDISTLSRHEWTALRRGELSMLFQDLRLFTELTALENIEIKNQLTNFKKRAEIISLFEELGIGEKLNKQVAHLSFGEQQRVAFIRSLCQPYSYIMLDEPVSHLDRTNSEILSKILLREVAQQGASIIATSIGHHMQLPYDRILKL